MVIVIDFVFGPARELLSREGEGGFIGKGVRVRAGGELSALNECWVSANRREVRFEREGKPWLRDGWVW